MAAFPGTLSKNYDTQLERMRNEWARGVPLNSTYPWNYGCGVQPSAQGTPVVVQPPPHVHVHWHQPAPQVVGYMVPRWQY